jgi:hypothetical protein
MRDLQVIDMPCDGKLLTIHHFIDNA